MTARPYNDLMATALAVPPGDVAHEVPAGAHLHRPVGVRQAEYAQCEDEPSRGGLHVQEPDPSAGRRAR